MTATVIQFRPRMSNLDAARRVIAFPSADIVDRITACDVMERSASADDRRLSRHYRAELAPKLAAEVNADAAAILAERQRVRQWLFEGFIAGLVVAVAIQYLPAVMP